MTLSDVVLLTIIRDCSELIMARTRGDSRAISRNNSQLEINMKKALSHLNLEGEE